MSHAPDLMHRAGTWDTMSEGGFDFDQIGTYSRDGSKAYSKEYKDRNAY